MDKEILSQLADLLSCPLSSIDLNNMTAPSGTLSLKSYSEWNALICQDDKRPNDICECVVNIARTQGRHDDGVDLSKVKIPDEITFILFQSPC